MKITQVSLTGDAIVNVGPASTLLNATGWMQQNCDQIPFPDFTVRYNCQSALAKFINTSTGPVESYGWDFGDASSQQNMSKQSNPTHLFETIGSFQVSLTVTSGGKSNAYKKEIAIATNTLPKAEIEYNSEIMFSSVAATQYQWFGDGELLVNESNRIFSYQGKEGLYQVILYDGQCNRPSEPLVISRTKENINSSFGLYPNPATEKVFYNVADVESLSLIDCFGRRLTVFWNSEESWADVSTIEPGMYILVIEKAGSKMSRRLVVKR